MINFQLTNGTTQMQVSRAERVDTRRQFLVAILVLRDTVLVHFA